MTFPEISFVGNIALANIINLHLMNKETKHQKSQVTGPKSQSW